MSIPSIITSNIFSKLGNSASLLPIAVKDVSHSAGMTTASYITGKKVEGKDRLIDEFGTQIIWIGGIPFYKMVIDKTLYKLKKFNPKVDIRVLKDENILKKAIEHAPSLDVKESLEKIAKVEGKINNQKTFKGLFMAKFVASTVLTLASYWALTSFRHKHTEKAIKEEVQKEIQQEQAAAKEQAKPATEIKNEVKPQEKSTFLLPKQASKNPSFGMRLDAVKDFMFNPVKNMMIVDGGITTERLAEARNPQDFMGYVIKEGAFWGFMYFAGDAIQHYFERSASKKNKKAINLDIKVLQDDEFKKSMTEKVSGSKTTTLKSSIEKFPKFKGDAEIYEYICKNPNDLVVKMLEKSGIVKKFEKTEKIDTQHFIDIKEVKKTRLKMKKLMAQYDAYGENNIDKFMKKVVSLKRGSIIKNISACVGVLGVVVPGIMLAQRLMNKDNKEFQVKKELKEKLIAQNFQGVNK